MQFKKHEKVWSTTDLLDEFNLDLNKSNGYQPRFSYSSNNSSFFSNHLNNVSNTRQDLSLTNGLNGHSNDDSSATTFVMKLKQNQGSFSDISTTKSQQISTTTTNGTSYNGLTSSSPKIVVKEINQPIKSNNTHSLYVAGLYKGLAQADLKKYFEKFGKIEKVTVPQVVDNIVDGQKYLFIRFEECSSVDKVLQNDYHTIKDVSVRTKPGKNV
jgi:RNA recognition motif. (a.k.a. RRM, RBD, or RNP domain)